MIKIKKSGDLWTDTETLIDLLNYLSAVEWPLGFSGRPFRTVKAAAKHNVVSSRSWRLEAWGITFRITTDDTMHETYLALRYCRYD